MQDSSVLCCTALEMQKFEIKHVTNKNWGCVSNNVQARGRHEQIKTPNTRRVDTFHNKSLVEQEGVLSTEMLAVGFYFEMLLGQCVHSFEVWIHSPKQERRNLLNRWNEKWSPASNKS